jgi:sec-independent protein translocase protein TatB
LPGVLRMVGQWMGKARKMAAEFQSQFQEAMREAEMADLKKSFDEVREAASGFSPAGVISSLQQDVSNSLRVEPLDKPAALDKPAETKPAPAAVVEVPAPDTPAVVDTPAVASEAEVIPAPTAAEELKDAKAS